MKNLIEALKRYDSLETVIAELETFDFMTVKESIMNWKKELTKIIKSGCTDSDIEDYLEEHSELNKKEAWNYIYEYNAPEQCKGE